MKKRMKMLPTGAIVITKAKGKVQVHHPSDSDYPLHLLYYRQMEQIEKQLNKISIYGSIQ